MNWKKDKRTLYVLLPAVLAIWGLIGWQVFSGLRPPDLPVTIRPQPQSHEQPKTTRSLSLDYEDPFKIRSSRSITSTATNKPAATPKTPTKAAAVTPPPQKVEKPWPLVRYLGMIKNLSTKRHNAMLQLENQTEMVVIGATWQELTVVRCEADSVQLRFEKETRWIKK